jgi:predicted protein tyrosine phosphatase
MIKKVQFVRAEIVANNALPDHAVISCNEPDCELYPIKEGWYKTLRLVFDDIDHLFEYDRRPLVIFNEEMAKQIIDFCNEIQLDDKVEGIIVHGAAGVSRSAGIAKFIAEKYNLRFNHNYSLYNKLVYRTLFNLEHKLKGEET